jgi:UDP-N-acetylglucosamine pyrophosphorylase
MSFPAFLKKMETADVSASAIRCFERSYSLLISKKTGLISEDAIQSAAEIPDIENLPEVPMDTPGLRELLESCAILKLNGGLGTSMGLEKAKSLLEVREGLTFLDLIVRQVAHFRQSTGANVRFLLMNSFSTSADTLQHLEMHSEIGDFRDIELLQNKIPKINAATMEPVEWPENPDLEWCPPGHGDLYPVLAEKMDALIASGIRYLFVSNSDNLGATLDPRILSWFAQSGTPFLMEVTARTESDRKGGHLAVQRGQLILRESAQCPDHDMAAFQDINRHRYFNTNNLWLRLDRLRNALREAGGFLPLPVIQNRKTVDPRNKRSTPVLQLETAMGAAIACFPDSSALVVPRTRFAPVKTTADLLTLRSDAYQISEAGEVALAASRNGVPPKVDLDDNYKLVDQLEAAIRDGAPSLKHCLSLHVIGKFRFNSGVQIIGDVTLTNATNESVILSEGKIEG